MDVEVMKLKKKISYDYDSDDLIDGQYQGHKKICLCNAITKRVFVSSLQYRTPSLPFIIIEQNHFYKNFDYNFFKV